MKCMREQPRRECRQKYSAYGDYLWLYFVAPGTGGLNGTEDILFHPDGSVLVTGFGNTTIKKIRW